MKTKLLVICILFVGLFAACAGPAPLAESPVAPEEIPATITSAPTAIATVRPTRTPWPSVTPRPCIAEGDQTYLNARLRGPGDVAVLCPGAVIELTGPVIFNAAGQQIYTEDTPLMNAGQCCGLLRLTWQRQSLCAISIMWCSVILLWMVIVRHWATKAAMR